VTVRIYNLLAQVVAVPVLQAEREPEARTVGKPVDGVTLSCGTYTAYWNGKYLNSSREAASGVYLLPAGCGWSGRCREEVPGHEVIFTP
jgi:hypothetical protein